MENYEFKITCDLKPDLEPTTKICRCCLSTEKHMNDVSQFSGYFMDLAGVNVSQSDGLPQWLCWECAALLQKSVRFKNKLVKAHNVLYEYVTRCAPFPIDAQDQELAKYTSNNLASTDILSFDNGKSKNGYHKVLQHKKNINLTELDMIDIPLVGNKEDNVKEETGFSDYEDNITLHEYRINSAKVEEVTEDDLAQLLEVTENMQKELEQKKKTKKKEDKKGKTDKVKKKRISADQSKEESEPKSSIRKQLELDPTKIRVITLNPEEQIKQREEESAAGLKFPFQCHLCFKGFNFEAKLENHMYKHSPSRGSFSCSLCTMYFPTHYSCSVHSLVHTRRYECLQCGRRMIDRTCIMDHYRTQHEGLLTLYTCHLCGKTCNNSKTHRGHMRNHHSGERPTCSECGKSFVNKDSLAEHLQIHQGIKNYMCGTCGKRFRTRTQIKHHQLKHSEVRDFYCVECDARFKSAHTLRQHLQKSLKHRDTQSFKYPCPRCDKRFPSSPLLSSHMSIQHDGVRPHRCPHCPAALATIASRNKHIAAVHRGTRPAPRHVCDTCGKAFSGKSVLINHVRTHTGEKPFECSICGRKFTQRTAMRTHVKLVHMKIRRKAKIKPETPMELPAPVKTDIAFKQQPIVFEYFNQGSWTEK